MGDAASKIALIVAADEPALFYSSAELASIDLEAIDVDDGVYPIAYDPTGNPYRVFTQGARVVIEPAGGEARPAELAALLRTFLAAVGEAPGERESLPELLARCERFVES